MAYLERSTLNGLIGALVCALPSPLLRRLKPETRGRLEFLRGHYRDFFPYLGPMNSQAHRLEIVRSIIERCRIETIIETGTYRGSTTEWLAQFRRTVHTVELDLRYHAFSALRLQTCRNVVLHRGHSVAVLEDLGASADAERATFFYLDAHWNEDVPLANELGIVLARFPRAVVMIDDFEVPGDSGYLFDDYGPGKALTLAYLAPLLPPQIALFWPSANSRWETGAKRGCVVFTANPDMQAVLASLPCLRPHISSAGEK
jgi:hypothetical protein